MTNIVEYNENELLIVDGNEKKLSCVVEQYLDFIKEVEEKEKLFKNKLKDAMIENGLYSEKVGKYSVSICFPKPVESLDEEKILMNESDETLIPFIQMRKEEEFDLEGLKEKYPEIYKEFYKEKIEATLDSEKLKKMRPDLFDKYKIVMAPNKEPYLTIKASKK